MKFGFRTYYEFQIFNWIQIHMVFKYGQILHLLSLLSQAVTYCTNFLFLVIITSKFKYTYFLECSPLAPL